jgi:hypothetical protein
MKRILSLLVFVGVVLSMSQLMKSCGSATQTADGTPTAGGNEPEYSCSRSIYNPTSCPWTFTVSVGGGGGNVWFMDDYGCVEDCNTQNGPCTLPAGCSVTIQYTTTNGIISGTWFATDMNGSLGRSPWNYSSNYPAIQCPYIQHSGNTGSVSVNDPANGDLTANACTW